jgi:hypothetical protein
MLSDEVPTKSAMMGSDSVHPAQGITATMLQITQPWGCRPAQVILDRKLLNKAQDHRHNRPTADERNNLDDE